MGRRLMLAEDFISNSKNKLIWRFKNIVQKFNVKNDSEFKAAIRGVQVVQLHPSILEEDLSCTHPFENFY